MEVKAIETSYKGYRFRSRLEARWAVFFDELGLKWKYEDQGFETKAGRYLPDFVVAVPFKNKSSEIFFEIKPRCEVAGKKVYLAGKMNGWRKGWMARGHTIIGPDETNKIHDRGLHGTLSGDEMERSSIVQECFNQTQESDIIFAWIDSLDCFGTLAELGFAKGIGRQVYCAVSMNLWKIVEGGSGEVFNDEGHGATDKVHDLWFIETISNKFGFFSSAKEGFQEFFPYTDEEKKMSEVTSMGAFDLAPASGVSCGYICHGDPAESRCTMMACGECFYRNLSVRSVLSGAFNKDQIEMAAASARSARFEFGESGALVR